MLVALDVPADAEIQVGDPAPAVSRDGDRTVVWLEGEHDIATAPVLADTLAKVTSAGAADLIVDLSGLTFLSATTIGVLIQGRNSLRRQSRNLCLRSPSRCARRVLDACGLAGLLEPGPTPPASVPHASSDPEAGRRRLERRLAEQSALAQFGQNALRATARGPLLAEAAALVRRALPAPAPSAFHFVLDPDDDDEVAFAASVADMLEAANVKLDAVEACSHAALHDPLTGLANRSLILDHLELALARAGRRSTLAAAIFLDLDDFKRVNDTQGHGAGDELLVQIAGRLRPALRPADTLGRWGGDEFVVVCEDLERASEATSIARRLAAALEIPFTVRDTELHVTASIGVAVSGGVDDEPALLIHAADSDMYRAKRASSAAGTSSATAAPAGS